MDPCERLPPAHCMGPGSGTPFLEPEEMGYYWGAIILLGLSFVMWETPLSWLGVDSI